jgi:hypothetical protein
VAQVAQQALPKERIAFDGTTLVLASQEKNAEESIKEYIPEGQTLEAWSHLASVRTYANHQDPKMLAGALVKQVKANYPQSPCSLRENTTTGESMVDFVVWPADKSFVEFNVFKYGKGENGGVVAQQYAIRDYKDPNGFLESLRPVRERVLAEMTRGLQAAPANGAPAP